MTIHRRPTLNLLPPSVLDTHGDPPVDDLGLWDDGPEGEHHAPEKRRRVYVTFWIDGVGAVHAYVDVPPTWTLAHVRRECLRRGFQEVSVSRDLLLLVRSRG